MIRLKNISFIVLLTILLAACGGPSGETPDESGDLMVVQIDEDGGMRFDPNEIVLTVGQRVRIILENQGQKDHEFMIGQNVIRMDDGAANGFEIDFFEGIEDLVEVQLGEGAMLMVNNEMIMDDMEMGDDEAMDMDMGDDDSMDMDMGDDDSMDMDMGDDDSMVEDDDHEDDEMDHMGWMVMNNAGSGTSFIEFTVIADMVGEWELGCFEDGGAHYDDGMRGTLVVVAQ